MMHNKRLWSCFMEAFQHLSFMEHWGSGVEPLCFIMSENMKEETFKKTSEQRFSAFLEQIE